MPNLTPTERQDLDQNFTALNNSMPYITVSTKVGSDYYCNGFRDDVQINLAISAVNAAGGGVVYVRPGTYNLYAPIILKSNVILQGAGMGVTTFKAINLYYASAGTNSLISQTSSSTNLAVYDITFDRNGQRENSPTIDGTALLQFVNCTFVRVKRCEFKNGIYYTVYVALSSQIWIQDNYVTSGWTTTSITNQQDGIHLSNCTFAYIQNNYVNTYGISSASVRSSGDDAIAIQADKTANTNPCLHIVISNNIILSGSRGIGLFVDAASVQHVDCHDNIIQIAQYSGIKLQRVGSTLTGVFKYINIHDNIIESAGALTTGQVEGAAGIEVDAGGNAAQTLNLVNFDNNIIELTTSTSGTPAGAGIFIPAKGNGVFIRGNIVEGLAGLVGIQVGASGQAVVKCNITNNDVSVANAGFIDVLLYDVTRGVIMGNYLAGAGGSTDNSYGIQINGIAGSNTIAVTGNTIFRTESAITEINGGSAPDYNNFQSNIFGTVVNGVTTVGTHSAAANNNTSP